MDTKRTLDLLVASLGFILIAPLFVAIAGVLLAAHRRPILFTQIRPGLQGRPFRLYKFRTMADARDPDGQLLPDEQRLTVLGRFLRSSSLDELPELLNVVKGDMSLVGPRPLLVEYLDLYTSRQARRHEVKPGITGWAQVNGRNALTWEDKLELDVWYVENRSVRLDLRILWLTIWNVLRRRGIYTDGYATPPKFTGSSGDGR